MSRVKGPAVADPKDTWRSIELSIGVGGLLGLGGR
jgi:hypothetical protein